MISSGGRWGEVGGAYRRCVAAPAASRAGPQGNNYVTVGSNYNLVGGKRAERPRPRLQQHADRESAGQCFFDAFGGANATNFALSLFSAAANRFLNLELSRAGSRRQRARSFPARAWSPPTSKALIEQGDRAALPSGDREWCNVDPVPQGQPQAGGDAADHAEGNVILDVDVNKDSRGTLTPQRLSPSTPSIREDAGLGRKRRHGGDRRHLHARRKRNREQGPAAGRCAGGWQSVQEQARTQAKTELLIFLTPKVVTERSAVR